MIKIKPSPTADCDSSKVTKKQLLVSSQQHIDDMGQAIAFFCAKLMRAAVRHDQDKLTLIDWFHSDFITNFEQTGWWDNHRKISRHHITKEDGIPKDINLLDVLEHIADCVMAGMARSGSVYELKIEPNLLIRAFNNTVHLLKEQVIWEELPEEARRD